MSMYKTFKTDETLEQKGIVIDYGDFRVTIARAGGANKKYNNLLEARTKPHRRAIQTDTFGQERSIALMREIYVDAVILNWETKVGDDFVVGIEDPNNLDKPLPFTKENAMAALKALPDLFIDLQRQADQGTLFREELLEIDSKN